MADKSETTARTGWQRETFVEHLLHAADEDESAGHSLQAAYIRDAADEIERLRAILRDMIKAEDECVLGDPCWGDREAELWRRAKEAVNHVGPR